MFKIFLSLSFVLLMSTAAMAQTTTTGYTGPGSEPSHVKISGLGDLSDNTKVMLTGRISKQDSDKKYEFTDGTGTVVLEIDENMWRNMRIGPNDQVQVYGELDKSIIGDNKIEVERLTKMSPSGTTSSNTSVMQPQTSTVSTTK